ncbi:MAG TPA: hypothetical protein VGK06_10755 [Methanosarcina sp.]|jgi:hypothetical protein
MTQLFDLRVADFYRQLRKVLAYEARVLVSMQKEFLPENKKKRK